MSNYLGNLYGNLPRQNAYGFGQKVEVVTVNGEAEANSYPIPPNSSILMLDSTQPVVWLKVTDAASYPTVTGYEITPIKKPVAPVMQTYDFTKLEERIANLERRFERGKSNTGNTSKSQFKPESSAE